MSEGYDYTHHVIAAKITKLEWDLYMNILISGKLICFFKMFNENKNVD